MIVVHGLHVHFTILLVSSFPKMCHTLCKIHFIILTKNPGQNLKLAGADTKTQTPAPGSRPSRVYGRYLVCPDNWTVLQSLSMFIKHDSLLVQLFQESHSCNNCESPDSDEVWQRRRGEFTKVRNYFV